MSTSPDAFGRVEGTPRGIGRVADVDAVDVEAGEGEELYVARTSDGRVVGAVLLPAGRAGSMNAMILGATFRSVLHALDPVPGDVPGRSP